MTPEEKEFMDALTRLFTSAQEFGLALAAIESDMNSLPQDVREALELGREVAKAVKSFQRIVRRRLEARVATR
jgi:mRNA degradation ribonuclease J1/J2